MLCCCTVPQRHPVVDPERQIDAPTAACVEPATWEPELTTVAVAVQLALTATHAMSRPGKVEPWKVPWATWL